MADRFRGRIVSVRLWHPREERELEVRFETANDVDAVFTSVNAVERILVPFYERERPADTERLLKEVREQEQGGVCIVLHVYRCTWAVPHIDWNARSPISL